MKTNFLVVTVVFLSCFLINCKSDSTSTKSKANQLSLSDTSHHDSLNNFVEKFSTKSISLQFGTDKILDYEIPPDKLPNVKSCLKAYLIDLKQHNYDTSDKVQLPITRSTSFGSQNLVNWLNKVTVKGTTTTDIHILYGKYTTDYLHNIDSSNPTKYDKKYLNRFGLFLLARDTMGGNATDASGTTLSAYDLGGLHP